MNLGARYTPEPNSGCWLWTGHVDRAGYGQARQGARTRPAHIVVWEVEVGRPVCDGMELDHLCRVRCCVNPRHLEQVTHQENMRRGGGFAGINARKTHCVRGHPFDAENTETRLNRNGHQRRDCRACRTSRRESRRAA